MSDKLNLDADGYFNEMKTAVENLDPASCCEEMGVDIDALHEACFKAYGRDMPGVTVTAGIIIGMYMSWKLLQGEALSQDQIKSLEEQWNMPPAPDND